MLNETLKPLAELPDVSFIDNDTIDAMMQRLVSNYERRYQEITGKEVTLGAADPMRIALYAVASFRLTLRLAARPSRNSP